MSRYKNLLLILLIILAAVLVYDYSKKFLQRKKTEKVEMQKQARDQLINSLTAPSASPTASPKITEQRKNVINSLTAPKTNATRN